MNAPPSRLVSDHGLLVRPAADGSRLRAGHAGSGKRLDTALFAESLAALLEAGLPVLDALRALGERGTSPAVTRMVLSLDRSLREGLSLSAALALHRDVFGDVIVALVQSAERTSSLAPSLARYAHDLRTQQAMRRRILGAALYPAVVIAVGALVTGFLLAYVVPRFADIVLQSGVRVSSASRILLEISAAMHEWQGLTIGLLAFIVAVPVFLVGTARGRALFARALRRMPGWGRTARDYQLARFFGSATLLLRGGMPVVRAIELAADTLDGSDRRAMEGVVKRLSAGQDIASAFVQQGIDDQLVIRLVEVGQRSGSLAQQFERLGQLLDLEVSRRLDWAARLFEPVLMLAVGVTIGAIVVLMYVPILELALSIE